MQPGLYGQRRVRRPPPSRGPIFTKTYTWKVISFKVWWPTTGVPPGWGSQAPGL